MKLEKLLLFIISLFTFLLLFYATSTVLLNGSDEEEHFWMASQISFNPNNLNIPLAFKDIDPHGLLPAYLIKLGFILFGKEGIISGRFIFVLLGVIGILLVYFLVKQGMYKRLTILSIIFLSVEKYYMCHMRYAISESTCIFFTILAIYIFFKALKENNRLFMILVGLPIGIGFYGKATTTLLFPIFFIYLLWDRQYRFWLRSKQIYIALLLFCGIAAPFVIYNLYNNLFTFQYIRAIAKFGLSPISLTVLFGESLSFLIDKSIVIHVFDCEYPMMNWLAGIVVLCGVIYSAIQSRNNSLIKLLLIVFSFTFVLFSIIGNSPEAEADTLFNSQNWPSMMVIPGVILAANMLQVLWNKYRLSRVFIVLFMMYLALDLIRVINLPESFYIPRRDLMVDELKGLAYHDLKRGYYGYAKKRLEKFLKWSDDEKQLREVRGHLIYLSNVAKKEDLKEYYVSMFPPSGINIKEK